MLCNLAAAVMPSIQEILGELVANLERAPTLLERCRCVEVAFPPPPDPSTRLCLLQFPITSESRPCYEVPRKSLGLSDCLVYLAR